MADLSRRYSSSNNADLVLHQMINKTIREHCLTEAQIKEFLRTPEHTDRIRNYIIEVIERLKLTLFVKCSKEELEKLSLLWITVLGYYHKSTELLVRLGIDVNEPCELRELHASYNINDKYYAKLVKNSTILHALLQMEPSPENERLIHLVTDHGADLHARDCEGKIVLHFAVKRGLIQMTEMLLKKGVDVNVSDIDGVTPLLVAVSNNKVEELLPLLVKHGADLQTRDNKGQTILHYAVREGRVQIAKMLLKKGADVNAVDIDGVTPLLIAVGSSKANELMTLLMKHGADVFARDSQGRRNALHFLAENNSKKNVDLARILIEKGVSLHDRDNYLNSQPIHLAVIKKNIELVKLFLDHGADVNSLRKDGQFPLYFVAQDECYGPLLMETLLKHGANVNQRTHEGYTALHAACKPWFKNNIIKLLVSAGADVLAEDCEGNTPLVLIDRQHMADPVIRLIAKTLALKKVSLPSVELKDEKIIKEYPMLWQYYQGCIEESNRMKLTRFSKTCSLHELLTRSHCQIAELMRNPNFVTKCKQCDVSEFSTYAEDIKRTFRRAKHHYHATLEQEDVINEAVYNVLPSLVVRKVIRYILINCCRNVT